MTAEHTPAPMIVLKGMSTTFNRTIHAVRDVDLEVTEGEVVVIVGPSGSGKSTVLRCVNLLEIPTKGTVVVDGFDLTDASTDLDHVRAEVGMVFQQFNLFPHLTVLENITLAQRKVRNRSKAEAVDMAADQMAAEAVGRTHGAFQVDDRTLGQLTERGQAERLGGGIGLEAAGVECDDGEADAVDGDALAHLHMVERQVADVEGEADIAADGFACGQTADAFDDSSKQETFSAESERKTPQGKQAGAGPQRPCGTVFFHPDYTVGL